MTDRNGSRPREELTEVLYRARGRAGWDPQRERTLDGVTTRPNLWVRREFGPSAPRVKGGWDFVGNDYNANNAGSTPVPDPNPLDCNSHGTHTAGTLAGSGVTSGGSTYTGPYNGSISTNPKRRAVLK